MFSGGIKVGPRPNWNAPPGPTHTPRSLRFQTTAAWLWPTVAKLLRLRFPKKNPRKRKITSAQREEPPPSRSLAPPRGPLLSEGPQTLILRNCSAAPTHHTNSNFPPIFRTFFSSQPDPNFFTPHTKRSHGRNAGFPGLTAVPHLKLSSLCTLTTTDENF